MRTLKASDMIHNAIQPDWIQSGCLIFEAGPEEVKKSTLQNRPEVYICLTVTSI